jgi:hypothetical protein
MTAFNIGSVFAETQRTVGFLVNKSSPIYLNTNIDFIVAPSLSYDSETFCKTKKHWILF